MNKDLIGTMRDVSAENGVQIQIQSDGLVIWLNIDGVCITRVMLMPNAIIEIEDNRE